ncbi:MAG TPA: SpoIIE family protein phosphatase, partial [Terriglobales bacterium]|nr:SpoIIE family protein phosphatase [Terriglobales bacterium]
MASRVHSPGYMFTSTNLFETSDSDLDSVPASLQLRKNRPFADLATISVGGVSELVRAWPGTLESGHACEDCDEHVREAKLIQDSLLPKAGLCHKSVELEYRFMPFRDVGGDFVDFFQLPDGLICIYLGDVVGKGLTAAMFAALVMGTLRGVHKSGTDTAAVLSRLNERLLQRPIRGRFCSTFYGVYNPATRELTFSNAGMPLPLLVSGNKCRPLGQGGLPSGLFQGATYEQHVVQLKAGDCVLFATDGLHELTNKAGVEFCDAEMKKVWAQCKNRTASESADFLFERQV